MRKILYLIIITAAIFLPLTTFAVDINDAGKFLGQVGSSTGLPPNLTSTAGTVVTTILALIGTIFFALTIYAGIRWMTAQGNDEKVTKAKDTLEAALIGICIVFLAYAITAFVTSKLVAPKTAGRVLCGSAEAVVSDKQTKCVGTSESCGAPIWEETRAFTCNEATQKCCVQS